MSLVVLGSATGFISGLLGISEASLVVPSLVAFLLLDHHAAQGIAISVALADSIAGTATHAKQGNIDYSVLRRIALPAIVLRNLFATFMMATWAMLVARLVRDYMDAKAVSFSGPAREQNAGLAPWSKDRYLGN